MATFIAGLALAWSAEKGKVVERIKDCNECKAKTPHLVFLRSGLVVSICELCRRKVETPEDKYEDVTLDESDDERA